MKTVNVNRTELLSFCKIQQKHFKRNLTLPILESILIKWTESELTLHATDLETYIIAKIPCLSGSKGEIVLNASELKEYLIKDKNIQTRIVIDDIAMKIIVNDVFQLSCEDAEEYPKFPTVEKTTSLDLSGLFQWELENQKAFLSTDDLRKSITGVFFGITEGKIQMTSTDAHSLRVLTLTDAPENQDWKVIIRGKIVDTILSVCSETKHGLAPVNFQFNELHNVTTIQNYLVIGRNIDEKYPNYMAVIPTESKINAQVKRTDLIESIKKAAIGSNKSTKQITFRLANDKIEITGESLELQTSITDTINCSLVFPEGQTEFWIGFNHKVLLKVLNSYKDDLLTLNFTDSNKPLIIKDNFITSLCMPVMLKP